MASLKDVAKLANVSLMTVSRALNSPERLKRGNARPRTGGYRTDQLRPRPVGEEDSRAPGQRRAPSACWRWIR